MRRTAPPKVMFGVRVEQRELDALHELQVQARVDSLSAFARRILIAYVNSVRRHDQPFKNAQ